MKITVLGCGSSGGVPLIGNNWGACDPNDPRNRRTRVSVLVEEGDTSILIDTSPDVRQQLLNCNLQNLSAVLYTHAHADHCHGIDDLRSVSWLTKGPIPIYADADTMQQLEERFAYAFHGSNSAGHFYRQIVAPHIIEDVFQIGPITITPFVQNHGDVQSLGFRLNNFAYSTDVKELDDAAFQILRGTKAWVVDCVREMPHPTHSHLAQTLEWIARVKPKQAFLTHLNHTVDYATLAAKCPKGTEPAYDGLVISC